MVKFAPALVFRGDALDFSLVQRQERFRAGTGLLGFLNHVVARARELGIGRTGTGASWRALAQAQHGRQQCRKQILARSLVGRFP